MSNKHKKHKKRLITLSPKNKQILVVAGGAGSVIIALTTVVILLNQPQSEADFELTTEQKATRDIGVQQAERDGAIKEKALAAIEEGDTAKAEEVYDEAINSEEDAERKVKLYIDQSGLLFDAGKVEEAIAVAKEAEALTSDKFLIADWLSRIYEYEKQYKLAAQYYSLAGEWADSPTNKTALDKAYYDSQAAKAAALEKK